MKVMNPSLPYLVRKAFRKQILDKAKKITVCPHCGELNGTVKKCGLLKIVHEKYRSKKATDPVITDALGEFSSSAAYYYSASTVAAGHWFVKACFYSSINISLYIQFISFFYS
jgi:hypothetical protein